MEKTSFNVTKIRRDFPILSLRVNGKPLVYLDNAATSQKPRVVIDKLNQFYKLKNANVHRGSHYLSNQATTEFEEARETLASFINANSTKEIIWCKGTTEAINLVANSHATSLLNQGDVILVSTSEHHANIVPWQLISEYHQLKIVQIPLTETLEIDLCAYDLLLKQYKPKVVAVGHVSNATGIIHPIKTIVKRAKTVNAMTLVDGAQAVGHMPVDVQDIGCDFYCFSSHKCLGPTGIGVLWGREELLDKMPPWQGGGEMIKRVSFDGTDFNTLPFKFEAGTPPIADAVAFATATNYLNSLERVSVREHEQALLSKLYLGCSAIDGINILSPLKNNAGIVSFTIEGIHHQDAALLLDQNGIAIRSGHHCAMPLMSLLAIDGTLRASIYFYNTFEEIDLFLSALNEIIKTLNVESTSSQGQLTNTTSTAVCSSSLPKSSDISDQLMHANSWQQRFSYIMTLADYLPLPSSQLLIDENKLQQCESGIWLEKQINELETYYYAWSDAKIMRGLIVLLISCRKEVETDLHGFLHSVKLNQFLSPSRTNGIRAIVESL